jgi:hypothetical protein
LCIKLEIKKLYYDARSTNHQVSWGYLHTVRCQSGVSYSPPAKQKIPSFMAQITSQNVPNTNICGLFRTRFRSSDRIYVLVPSLIIIWLPPTNESRGLPTGIQVTAPNSFDSRSCYLLFSPSRTYNFVICSLLPFLQPGVFSQWINTCQPSET